MDLNKEHYFPFPLKIKILLLLYTAFNTSTLSIDANLSLKCKTLHWSLYFFFLLVLDWLSISAFLDGYRKEFNTTDSKCLYFYKSYCFQNLYFFTNHIVCMYMYTHTPIYIKDQWKLFKYLLTFFFLWGCKSSDSQSLSKLFHQEINKFIFYHFYL